MSAESASLPRQAPPVDGCPLLVGLKLRQHEVQVARGPARRLAAAWTDDTKAEGTAGWTCAYAVSGDWGRSWSRPLFRRHPAFPTTANPTIAVDGSGRAFAVSMSVEGYSRGVLEMSISADDGRTWSAWEPIVATRNGIPDRPKLAVAPDGTLHLVYTEVERTETIWKPLRTTIRVICSGDHGKNWSEPRTLSGLSHRSRLLIEGYQGPAVLAAPNGALLVSWASYYGNHAHFSSSRDSGVVFEAPVAVRLQALPGKDVLSALLGISFGTPATELAVDATGRTIAVSVHEAHVMGHILLVGSRDGGSTWSRLARLTRCGTNASLAFDSRGRLHAMWTEMRDRRVDTRYAVSGDGGRGFAPSVSLARGGALVAPPRSDVEREECEAALGSYQSLVIDEEDRVFAAWIDLRAGLTAPRLFHAAWGL